MRTLTERIASNVFAHRDRLGWSQADLAEKAQLTERTIRNVESGRYDAARLSTIFFVARALGVGIDALIAPLADEQPEALAEGRAP